MSDSYKIYASQDYVDSKVPDTALSNQYLTTDKDGIISWKEQQVYDNDIYSNTNIDVTNIVSTCTTYNDSLNCYSGVVSFSDYNTFMNTLNVPNVTYAIRYPTANDSYIHFKYQKLYINFKNGSSNDLYVWGNAYLIYQWASMYSNVTDKNIYLTEDDAMHQRNPLTQDDLDTGEPFCFACDSNSGNYVNTSNIMRVCSNVEFDGGFVFEYSRDLKTLATEFIPSTVPVVQSASVGQTIVVKSVDENGKPMEWEAVDMASGSGLPEGATAHQQLVTDGEGNAKWEDRTHWKNVTNFILLDNVEVDATAMPQAMIQDVSGALTSGDICEVVINNTSFTAVATALSEENCYVGNASLLISELPNTGEDYFIGTSEGVVICAFAEKGTYTISVNVSQVIYAPLAESYIPDTYVKSVVWGDEVDGVEFRKVALRMANGENMIVWWGDTKVRSISYANDGYEVDLEDRPGSLLVFPKDADIYDRYGSYSDRAGVSFFGDTHTIMANGAGMRGDGFIVRKSWYDSDVVFRVDWNGNMYLKSSTEGSTKHFKITVDDSGTLTATEVT